MARYLRYDHDGTRHPANVEWRSRGIPGAHLARAVTAGRNLWQDHRDRPAPKPATAKAPARVPAIIPRWKRVLDVGLILLAVPVLLPLMLLIAIVIRLVSSGPVLFRQERIGHLGRRFICLKFRTMAEGNDTSVHQDHLARLMASGAPMVKMDSRGDRRIIPFGVPLRASGLDELPQIINVLRGDMSLVGPRPCVQYEYERYLSWQKERFNTLPGLTGLWQVSGKNRTTFDEMIRLDIDYARNQTLWLDLKIIACTIPALLVQIQDTRRLRKAATPSTASFNPAPNQRLIPAR